MSMDVMINRRYQRKVLGNREFSSIDQLTNAHNKSTENPILLPPLERNSLQQYSVNSNTNLSTARENINELEETPMHAPSEIFRI
jgi:hypothetical protein